MNFDSEVFTEHVHIVEGESHSPHKPVKEYCKIDIITINTFLIKVLTIVWALYWRLNYDYENDVDAWSIVNALILWLWNEESCEVSARIISCIMFYWKNLCSMYFDVLSSVTGKTGTWTAIKHGYAKSLAESTTMESDINLVYDMI